MIDGYSVEPGPPSADDYRRLRAIAGLTPRSAVATMAGLPNSCLAVVVRNEGKAVGMGRIVGDGALFFQIVDIAVDPTHQGRGVGKAIMAALVAWLEAHAPAEAYVSLIADGRANELYAQYGFEPTAPASIGMARWFEPPSSSPSPPPAVAPA